MADLYSVAGISLFSVNLRASNCITEGYGVGSEFRYIGGSYEDFATCVEDIHAAVGEITGRRRLIALQGHSLGCDRIIHYQLNKGCAYPTILLAPCDSYMLQANYIRPETVESQIQRLQLLCSSHHAIHDQLLPLTEYGVKSPGETYHTPISVRALLSILTGPPFYLIRQDGRGVPWTLDSDGCIFVGKRDNLQTLGSAALLKLMKPHFRQTELRVLDADHDFNGCEWKLAAAVVSWVGSR
jgi:hypothetical protein